MNLRSQTKPGNTLVCNMFSYSLFYTLSIKINVCTSSDVADILLRDKSLLHYSAVISDNYRNLQYYGLHEQISFPSPTHEVCMGTNSHKEVGLYISRDVKISNLLFLHSKMVFKNPILMGKKVS